MIPVDYSYDGNQRLEFWNSVKLDDSSGFCTEIASTGQFWNSVKLGDSSGTNLDKRSQNGFWNSVKLDDSSGSNYTASKNKK